MDAESFHRAEAVFAQIIASGPVDAARTLETITRTDPDAGKCLRPVVDAYVTHTATGSTSRPEHPPRPLGGGRIGRYVLDGCIGRGGMGTVYRAHDPEIGRVVALKVLHAHDDRFLSEVRAAGTLKHPNIVTIHDCAKIDGQSVIVMEYVEGRTVYDLILKRRAGDVSLRLRLLRQLCAALDYAHERGIVHRDIKPANLIVDANNELKVLDFGIARMGEPRHRLATSIVGTLRYMSPEQMRGREVDRRSDIFAVGVVAYELLTYRYPFERQSAVQLAFAIAYEPPPPLHKLAPILDARLEPIVGKALEKSPSNRYVTLAEMLRELASIERPRAVEPAPPVGRGGETKPRKDPHGLVSPLTWLAIVLPLLAAIVVATLLIGQRRALPDGEGASAASAAAWFETGARLAGLGDAASLNEGLALLERSCRAGEPRACHALGDLYQQGSVVPAGPRRALALYDEACSKGHPASCIRLGMMHRHGVQVPANLTAAADAFSRACELGSSGECNDAGVLRLKAETPQRDTVRARALLTRACENDVSAGCVNLARQMLASTPGRQEMTQAIDLLERGCGLGFAEACAQAGTLLLGGAEPERDVSRAVRLFDRACAARVGRGCLEAAEVYADSGLVPRELAKAANLYKAACEAGESTGCAHEAGIYAEGRGVRKDEGRAIALWMHSCDGGVAEACDRIAERFATGAGLIKDDGRAADFRRRARHLRRQGAPKGEPHSWTSLLMADGRPY